MWILEPISIATQGYVGVGPLATGFCPAPLAIASHGYIRFEVAVEDDPFGGGTGVRVFPVEGPTQDQGVDPVKIALAIVAIEEMYD